jgi:ribosomal-protein-alanine N-acetyltransferase
MADNYRLRPASSADLGGLVSLERASFSDPWTAAQLADTLARESTIGVVIENETGHVVGYLFGSVVFDQAEILTLAVDPAQRRQGLGRRLLDAMLDAMAGRGIRDIWLEVRASNEGARALYAQAGFIASGVRRSYYRRPVEDALVLRRDRLVDASARPPLR